jgi:hypothetical protein
MKRQQSGKTGDTRNQWNLACSQASHSASEISGYADIGMKKEALRAVSKVLAKHQLLPEEFDAAVRTLGMYLGSKAWQQWKPKVEAAYNRQSRQFKRKARL